MKNTIVNYQGSDFVTCLAWVDLSAQSSGALQAKIKETIRRKKYDHFGVKIEKSKTEKQIGFAEKSYKGLPALSKFFSNDSFLNSLIVLQINPDDFWICDFTKNGKIAVEEIVLFKDLNEKLSEIVSLHRPDTIFINEDEQTSFEELGIIDIFRENELDSIQSININEILSQTDASYKIDSVYNATADTIKQLGLLGVTVFILAIGYQKVYKENPLYESILNQEESISFINANNNYAKFIKKQEENNANAYKLQAKEQLIKIHNITYTNDEIFNYLKKLYLDFPIYLVEWQLNDIKYINDNGKEFFRVEYKRIDNSFGFLSSIQKELNDILKEKNYQNYQISVPSPKGDVVYVEFMFKNKKPIVIKKVNSDEIKSKIQKFDKQIKNISSNIEGIESSVMELGFFDKRFGSTLEEKRDEIDAQVVQGMNLIKKSKKQRNLLKVEDIDIDESIISGSQSDMLNMMQSYSYYNWQDGNTSVKYPILNVRSAAKNAQYYAESYNFSVDVGSNINLIGLDNLKTILDSNYLLNKPYIIIKEVSFNLNSDVWSIKGSYYEKTNQ